MGKNSQLRDKTAHERNTLSTAWARNARRQVQKLLTPLRDGRDCAPVDKLPPLLRHPHKARSSSPLKKQRRLLKRPGQETARTRNSPRLVDASNALEQAPREPNDNRLYSYPNHGLGAE